MSGSQSCWYVWGVCSCTDEWLGRCKNLHFLVHVFAAHMWTHTPGGSWIHNLHLQFALTRVEVPFGIEHMCYSQRKEPTFHSPQTAKIIGKKGKCQIIRWFLFLLTL